VDTLYQLCAFIKGYLNFGFNHELIGLAALIFVIGVIGLLDSTDFFSFLVSLEVVMLGVNFYLLT
jgi:NADH:ubiquinone oxidoreductase subunit K